ncbi:MAG: peptidylprolyl isomerase [Deltaproteobacteria bacterium]|nr:MAG: peptidylprolyl isomerase [Deltaproteobacteria bacterium]
MSSQFRMTHRESHGNLHIRSEGVFDGHSAWELINLITNAAKDSGRIFIDTNRLEEVCPFGCHTFKTRMDFGIIPSSRLYFKGPKGFELAPDGSRVIIVPTAKKAGKRLDKPFRMACPGCQKHGARAMEG